MVDLSGPVIQAFLFALFSGLTTILQAIIGPTYNGLVVPELSPSSLFPAFPGDGGSLYGTAVGFSDYLLVRVVDPGVVLIALGLGLLFLARSFLGSETVRLEGALPRLIVYVSLANLTVPVAGALLDLAGSIYPLVAGYDGGSWEQWTNLAGAGGYSFSWDNGALAFVISFLLFSLVVLLASAIALRDALLAFLLVVLPALTLAGALPPLRPLARRAWLLFAEAAFLPCVLVVPLELAVGSSSILLLAGFLGLALASPALLSLAGTQLGQLGFPSAAGAISGGIQRGLGVASLGAGSYFRPFAGSSSSSSAGKATSGISSAVGAATRVPLPGAAPLAFGELIGRGAGHLVRHISAARHGHGESEASEFDDPIYRRFPPTLRELM